MENERVARLETKVEVLEERSKSILQKLDDIDHKLTRQKGFIGGIMFLVMAMATALGFAKDFLFHGMFS